MAQSGSSVRTERPYNRPPLSKGLWKGKAIDSIWRGTDATDAALHLGRTVVHLDPPNRRVIDDQGAEYTYDQPLLATGGTPRRFPFGGDHIPFCTTSRYPAPPGVTAGGPPLSALFGGGNPRRARPSALGRKRRARSLSHASMEILASLLPSWLPLPPTATARGACK